MAIAIRGTTPTIHELSGTGTLSVTLTGAKQPQTNDLLLIFHGNDFYNFSNMVTPLVGGSSSGVNAISGGSVDAGANQSHTKSYTYAVGSAGDLTVTEAETGSADEERYLMVYVLSGVETATPIDGTPSTGSDTSAVTTRTLGAITTATTDAMLFAAWSPGPTGVGGNASAPPSSPWVEDYDNNIGGSYLVTSGHEQLSASGSTGTRTSTATSAQEWSGVMVAVWTLGSSGGAGPAVPNIRIVSAVQRLA